MRFSIWTVTAIFVALSAPVSAQVSLTAQTTTTDFAGFTGAGFTAVPGPNQLDSDSWSVVGLSDGNVNFGGTGIGGDFSRGTSLGGETPGGIYAFTTPSGTVFGVQTTSSDFTPGNIKLAMRNDTGVPVTSVEVSYTISSYNDGDRSTSVVVGHAPDDISYIDLPSTQRESVSPAETNPQWFSETVLVTITGLAISDGGYLYLRWTFDDFAGSGTRDELGLLNVAVTIPDLCNLDSDCDDGIVCNGTETCETGLCQSGTPLADDGISCTVDSCDEGTLITSNTPTDILCTNGLFCDGEEVCNPGHVDASINGCVDGTPVDIDDAIPCTLDSCDESINMVVNMRSDGFCANGTFCDGDEICLPNDVTADANGCVVGVPPAADDARACTDDSCDEANDTIVNVPNDSTCDDLQFCNGIESCVPLDPSASPQGCIAGTPVVTTDGIGCTDDVCDEALDLVINIPNDDVCSDGLFCTGTEQCVPTDTTADGVGCIVGVPPVIDDNINCTIDSCDEILDTVLNTPDHTTCADSDPCTADVCDPIRDCTNAVAGCTITGTCFGDGTVNPFNRCEVCDITKNFDNWVMFSQNTVCGPASCNSTDELHAENVCNDRGECIVPSTENCTNGCSNAACNDDCITDDDCRGRSWCDVGVCRNDNRPPTVSIRAPTIVQAGISFAVEASGGDLDGDRLTFVWSSNDTNVRFEAVNGITTSVVANGGPRPIEIQVNVSDGEVSVIASVMIDVTAANEEDVGEEDVGTKVDTGSTDAGTDIGGVTDPRPADSSCATTPVTTQVPLLLFLVGLILRRKRTGI